MALGEGRGVRVGVLVGTFVEVLEGGTLLVIKAGGVGVRVNVAVGGKAPVGLGADVAEGSIRVGVGGSGVRVGLEVIPGVAVGEALGVRLSEDSVGGTTRVAIAGVGEALGVEEL